MCWDIIVSIGKGEPLGLSPWEARISLVVTMGCGVVRHFLAVCDSGLRTCFWIP